jgi:hypothetical protein
MSIQWIYLSISLIRLNFSLNLYIWVSKFLKYSSFFLLEKKKQKKNKIVRNYLQNISKFESLIFFLFFKEKNNRGTSKIDRI